MMFARPPARDLPNTAGEPEPEALSRRWNLVEPFVIMTLLLTALWALAYPFGVLGGVAVANTITRAFAGLLMVYIFFISPWRHRDTTASRGLGSPGRVMAALRSMTLGRRLLFGALLFLFIVFLTALAYQQCPGVLRFLLGVPRDATIRFRGTLGGQVVVLCGCAGLAWLWAMFIVRYDNFGSALRTAGRILMVLLPPFLLVALLVNGPAAFATFDARGLAEHVFGYIFWGAFQQLIFCSYFGTRLRKGIGPAAEPRARRRRRLGVAVLSGLFFGLIHISSWWLVAVTWILGVFLSWVFMEDRNRNVLALGLVHGVSGACLAWLFRRGSDVYISLRVGPWAMSSVPDTATIVVTTLVISSFLAFILLAARRPEPNP
ncbi:MAG: CPBP family intramembrane metalloprotease [Verrucomicrobia bacterium]|nr:CPBP family intramembrane metalloprotease [Verrucomicrobiota bacterium]